MCRAACKQARASETLFCPLKIIRLVPITKEQGEFNFLGGAFALLSVISMRGETQ
jgi:hypothetical protein